MNTPAKYLSSIRLLVITNAHLFTGRPFLEGAIYGP